VLDAGTTTRGTAMIALYDLMLKAQNGSALDVMAKQFGLAQQQANEAVSALMPAFSEGMKRSAANPYDFSSFLKALYSGEHAKYFEDMTKAFTPVGVAEGNDLLSQFFGSKEVSRAIAAQAAQMTGIGQEIYKQMLPVVANTLMGGLFKQSTSPFFPGMLQQSGDNPFLAAMQQWMEATGMARKPEPQTNPFSNPFNNPFTQAFFGTAPKKEAQDLFADNPFAKAFADMVAGMSGKKPETDAAPEKAETPADSWSKFVNTLFDTGLEMQKDYQKNIEGIFDTMTKQAETGTQKAPKAPKDAG
jgi:hypothetical protein